MQSLERALALMRAIVEDGGASNVSRIAKSNGIPPASAHRIVRTLARCGFLVEADRGKFAPGRELRALASNAGEMRTLASLARAELNALARATRRIAHLGVLEDDMVTYLVKAGTAGEVVFTREGMQLEAYCSGIGKVLLAHLPSEALELYLASGPFVALTEKTKTDPAVLREELDAVRNNGFAIDDREVASDLHCFAVPLHWPDGRVRAAISLACIAAGGRNVDGERLLAAMRKTCAAIERRMFQGRD
jgi:DNA-binding IclR family transcriptional regulator